MRTWVASRTTPRPIATASKSLLRSDGPRYIDSAPVLTLRDARDRRMQPSSPVTSLTLLDQLRQPNRPDAWKRFEQLYTRLLQAWARRQGFQEADVVDL